MNLISPKTAIENLKQKCNVEDKPYTKKEHFLYDRSRRYKNNFNIPKKLMGYLNRDGFSKRGATTLYRYVRGVNFYVYPCKKYSNITWLSIPVFDDFGFSFRRCDLNLRTTKLILDSNSINENDLFGSAMNTDEAFMNKIISGNIKKGNNILTIELFADNIVLKK